jgi:hypothetical protein
MSLNLLVCATALFLGLWHQQAPDSEGVLRREQQRVDYLVAGKLDQFAEMLSPTLTYTHASAAIDSKDKLLGDLRSGRVVYRSLKHQDVQVRFPTPDVAILNGQSDVEVVVAGQAQSVPLRFTIVYVKKNGAWLMEAWHAVRRPA